jgi:hypothetical protein
MPSDAVTITAALAAPTVAGLVAVVIHHQRLAHEREQADLAILRELLARGAEQGMQVESAAWEWFREGIGQAEPRPTNPESAALDHADDEWRRFLANLQVLLPEGDPILVAAEQVDRAIDQLLYEAEGIDKEGLDRRPARVTIEAVVDSLRVWRRAASDAGHARL